MSDQRCPRCGAARRPGDQWCGLCYADFREPPSAVVGDGSSAAAPAVAPPPTAPAPDAGAPPLIRPPDPPGVALPPANPAPAPPQPPQPGPPAGQPAGSPFVPSTHPVAPAATIPTQLPAGVAPTAAAPAPSAPAAAPGEAAAGTAEAGTAEPAADLKWPCPTCQALVPMAEDHCPACGTGFLQDSTTGGRVQVPLFGDVGKMNTGQKLLFGSAIAIGIILGIIALLTIGGHIF